MQPDEIIIRGAREHNLKNVDVVLPRFKLVVITGVSGSGKSSLAFDTLYAEGQRRYVESLSAYARQFIGQMEKPRVDFIGGLSPAIAIEQKAVSKNPRSTVGTVTEIHDYLRVLFARAGRPHCPQCGREVRAQSAQQIVAQIAGLPPGTRFQLLAPLARGRKGAFRDLFARARADGYARARVDGEIRGLDEKITLDKNQRHDVELVVDRLVVEGAGDRGQEDKDLEDIFALSTSNLSTPSLSTPSSFLSRLTDSIETALEAGDGIVIVVREGEPDWLLSERHACPVCGLSFPELSPQMFSFNSPAGMCPECNGLGTKIEFDPARFVEPEKSLHDGGVRTFGELRKKRSSGTYQVIKQIVETFGHDLDTPWRDLSIVCQNALLYGGVEVTWESSSDRASWSGTWDFEGTLTATRRRYRQTQSEHTRKWYASFMGQQPCDICNGQRLRPESLAVTVGGRSIVDVSGLSIGEAVRWVEELVQAARGRDPESGIRSQGSEGRGQGVNQSPLPSPHSPIPNPQSAIRNSPPPLTPEQFAISEEILKEIHERLKFLVNVGLHYLALDRPAPTLSGGEGQRIRLASQIGCGLVGVLYVLDEPSIGLHQRDNRRLLDTLEQLRDMGNTVVVVEHDEETIRTADWVLDLGPGAGVNGGEVVAEGPPAVIMAAPASLTGRYLRGDLRVCSPSGVRRPVNGRWLTVMGARQNNLKGLDVRFPLGLFTCVAGVSGSGKSSLVAQILYPALANTLHNASQTVGVFDRIEGLEGVDKVINITQDPIGRTPRSNPATYVQAMNLIRELFASTPEARARGYGAGRFSFNVKGGRCEVCQGHGQKQIEMHFLPDVWVTCNVCSGARFNAETLQVRYKGSNIAEVLDMDIAAALAFFDNVPKIRRILQTLVDVGLGYVKLGQSATTLSGGEAQRVKLAKELARASTGDTVYILDEPTTGLHFADIQKLLDVLHRLTDAGNTVIVIEHNLDVLKTADWIIDLGPEGGDEGGQIVAQGRPEAVAAVDASSTGRFLSGVLEPFVQSCFPSDAHPS